MNFAKKATLGATIVAALAVAMPACAQGPYCSFMISASETSPTVNAGPVSGGVRSLYLWYYCSTGMGLSAAAFDIGMPAGALNFGFAPRNGFLNSGTYLQLLLSVGGCPAGPVVVGNWNVFDFVSGDYCLVPSTTFGTLAALDCHPVPAALAVNQVGYSAGGTRPGCWDYLAGALICEGGVGVEPSTWGSVKALYR